MAIVGCPLFGSRYLRSAMNVQFHARPRFMNHPSWSHITTTIRVITSDTTTFRVTPSQVYVWYLVVYIKLFAYHTHAYMYNIVQKTLVHNDPQRFVVHAYMHACMQACMHACVHACMRASIHPSMHACMHAYIAEKHEANHVLHCSLYSSLPGRHVVL